MTPFFYPTIIALLLAWTVVARADTVPAFVPPEIYRTIHFEEYGGGPMRKYVDGFLEEVRLHQVLKKRYRIEIVDARDWTRGYSAAYNQAMRQAAENRLGSVWWVDSLQEAGIDLTIIE